ncbi:MAG: CAP domain-containing protein [Phycisphaerae bacterium]|nr:CAP domain-containing protein [Phycisphaerae bacterium]
MPRWKRMNRRFLLVALWAAVGAGCLPPSSSTIPNNGGGGTTTPSGSTGGGFPTGSGSVEACLGAGSPSTAIHQALFDALNLYRMQNGLSPLKYSTTLEKAADDNARDQYQRHFFDHINPDGDGPDDRAVDAGFCHPYVGENIAYGQNVLATVTEVMEGWKASPTHNASMLEPDFEYVGMGYYHVTVGLDNLYYWAQLLAFDY